jgi:putative transposase
MALTGIQLQAKPRGPVKRALDQWMGCDRVIWNAKCDEERYYRVFARKYCPLGTYAPIDQTYAQFKSRELTPWLFDCPSQVLRNSAVNWYDTYTKYLRGKCGRPRRKPKTDQGSVHLTRELFRFVQGDDGVQRLQIGTVAKPVGLLPIKRHRAFGTPSAIRVRKAHGRYWVSFCYENGQAVQPSAAEHLSVLRSLTEAELQRVIVGIDRGVAIPVQAGEASFDFSAGHKRSKAKAARYIARLQCKLARQQKGSNRRQSTKRRLGRQHAKLANVRKDFAHQTSRRLVDSPAAVFVFEDLRVRSMTRKPKAQQDASGRFLPNKAKAKAGLNRRILDVGWHQLAAFTGYKALAAGKVSFKIPAPGTSQECAACHHIDPDNRPSQAVFVCQRCGHTDHADRNASAVIKHRAIQSILDPGTGLSERGVLLRTDTGRGAVSQSPPATRSGASGCEASRKKRSRGYLLVA